MKGLYKVDKVIDTKTARAVIRATKACLANTELHNEIQSGLDSLSSYLDKVRLPDNYTIEYRVVANYQGGSDQSTYNNMLDVIRNNSLKDASIIELAGLKLGQTMFDGQVEIMAMRAD